MPKFQPQRTINSTFGDKNTKHRLPAKKQLLQWRKSKTKLSESDFPQFCQYLFSQIYAILIPSWYFFTFKKGPTARYNHINLVGLCLFLTFKTLRLFTGLNLNF